ncbi:hypothetical protein K437DRAFT_259649 [Tilletiaria anomala UBC 951]|uniref:Uncharacterized protein n=1 Tax=Tilletiaria anomala (strain ATCC 24038 / CBS 436.72 / UBC 951) TaxID=1037660 RepID=A0A066VGX1_TILAU|nr:uncharacterized protein K437DRAFT_259649 [Tilletiaria anomala UBC 951]KDN37810.1 hypothetical protein K437DRAFT_259649 [Tilletiaria anomala UBC 951]
MVAPSGTYDALTFPVALPKSVVMAMLPDWLQNAFLPIPEQVYDSLCLERKTSDGEDTHIIVLQLGYQHGTGVGPSIIHMSFHEAKIDIPYLKHWHRKHIESDAIPFVYKQVIIFSSRLLQISGLVIPGSRSLLGAFGPDQTPSSYGHDPSSMEYNIKDLLEAEFTREDQTQDADSRWPEVKRLIEMPWFGGKTGKAAVEFHFQWDSEDALPVKAYHVETTLTPKFLGIDSEANQSIQVSTTAWRFKAPFSGVEQGADGY